MTNSKVSKETILRDVTNNNENQILLESLKRAINQCIAENEIKLVSMQKVTHTIARSKPFILLEHYITDDCQYRRRTQRIESAIISKKEKEKCNKELQKYLYIEKNSKLIQLLSSNKGSLVEEIKNVYKKDGIEISFHSTNLLSELKNNYPCEDIYEISRGQVREKDKNIITSIFGRGIKYASIITQDRLIFTISLVHNYQTHVVKKVLDDGFIISVIDSIINLLSIFIDREDNKEKLVSNNTLSIDIDTIDIKQSISITKADDLKFDQIYIMFASDESYIAQEVKSHFKEYGINVIFQSKGFGTDISAMINLI